MHITITHIPVEGCSANDLAASIRNELDSAWAGDSPPKLNISEVPLYVEDGAPIIEVVRKVIHNANLYLDNGPGVRFSFHAFYLPGLVIATEGKREESGPLLVIAGVAMPGCVSVAFYNLSGSTSYLYQAWQAQILEEVTKEIWPEAGDEPPPVVKERATTISDLIAQGFEYSMLFAGSEHGKKIN